MFKKSPRQKFNKCTHKSVKLALSKSNNVISAQLDCPQTQEKGSVVMARAENLGNGTKLKGIYNNRYADTAAATKHLGLVAAEQVCATCPFARMSELEVAHTRAESAMARRAIAEIEREAAEHDLAAKKAQDEAAEIRKQIESVF